MMSEVEERPTLVTASYGQHRSQWVKAGKDPPTFNITGETIA